MKLEDVELNHKSQEFYCKYRIKGDEGYTEANLNLGGLEMGGYQLFEVDIGVPCFLSELSVLSAVKILHLETVVRIDDLSGLENMGELQYVLQRRQKNNPMSTSFTDEDIEKIKEMYPGCVVKAESYWY